MKSKLYATTSWLLLLLTSASLFAAPLPGDILKKVDDVMAPEKVTMKAEMMTHRSNGVEKTYRLMIYKREAELVRIEFIWPPVENGRKILRKGEDMWMQMKTLKRPIRIAAKDNFMGGDFNNADVLRLNLARDYTAKLASETPTQWLLDLKAKNRSVTYDGAKLWVNKNGYILTKAQYFTLSGKMLRQLELSDIKSFRGHRRPAKMVMRNMISKKTWSVMTMLDMEVGKTLPASMYRPASLSR